MLKIAVVGAGSTYSPELVSGFLKSAADLGLVELVLMDIDAARLEVVGGFAQRMVAAAGSPFVVRLTTEREGALAGASFVITQIRVGGMAARREDEYLGRRWNLVGQETTGVGGFAKGLRTVPIIVSIARDMQRLCPDAWLINFSNPSGLVAEALQRYAPETRSVGLCNSPIGYQMRIAKDTGAEPKDVELEYLGLNHLSWLTGARVKGEDVWPQTFAAWLETLEEQADRPCPRYLAELLQAIPNYYLRYYYRTAATVARQAGPSRAEQVMDIERDTLAQYADPNLTELPDELMLRGGAYYSTAAVQLINSIHSDRGDIHIVNTRHDGAVPGWPADWVCELACRIDSSGAHALPAKPLPPLADSLVRSAKAYELLAAEAAMSGDRATALMALIANPLGPDPDHAPDVLDDLLKVNAKHLPQFVG